MIKNALTKEMAKAAVVALAMCGSAQALGQDDNAPPLIPDVQSNSLQIETTGDEGQNAALNGVSDQTHSEQVRDFYTSDLPLKLVLAVGALGLGVAGFSVYKKTDGAVARTLSVAFCLAAIASAEYGTDLFRTPPTIVPVFIDKSASVGDRAPMIEEAFTALKTELSSLGPVDIRRIEFGSSADAQSQNGTYFSNTFASTLITLPTDRVGGAFILSDGIIVESDQRYFLQTPFEHRVHGMIVGHAEEEDFRIQLEAMPASGYTDDEDIEFTFRIVDARTPDSDDLIADVDITFAAANTQHMQLPVNQSVSVKISDLAPEGLLIGKNTIEIEIDRINGARSAKMDMDNDGQPDEVTTLNNQIVTSITGVNSSIKALLFTGEPHQGSNLWRKLLENDKVTIDHLPFLRPKDKRSAAIPMRDHAIIPMPAKELLGLDHIDEYDVIILDNLMYTGNIAPEYFENIRSYVERGGGLIIVGSETLAHTDKALSQTALFDLYPMKPGTHGLAVTFTPQMTDFALRHPVGRALHDAEGWENRGPWYSMTDVSPVADSLVILTGVDDKPLLALREYGDGHVAMLASNQAFAWDRAHLGGGSGASLYRIMASWAMKDPRYDDERLTLRNVQGKITADLRSMQDAEDIEFITPSGKHIKATPEGENGIYSANIDKEETGVYQVRRANGEITEDFVVVGNPNRSEYENVLSDTEIFRPLMDQTSGNIVRISDAAGKLLMPEFAAQSDGSSEANSSVMQIQMSNIQEKVGSKREPYLPSWAFALASGSCLLLSFRQKQIAQVLSSPFKKDDLQTPEL